MFLLRAATAVMFSFIGASSAYSSLSEFYPVSIKRASLIMRAWGKSPPVLTNVITNDEPLIVAWNPEFRARWKIPEALIWSCAHHDKERGDCWYLTDLHWNPISSWSQSDIHRRQSKRILEGLLDIAGDANATLDLSHIAQKEPVLWLESVWMKALFFL